MTFTCIGLVVSVLSCNEVRYLVRLWATVGRGLRKTGRVGRFVSKKNCDFFFFNFQMSSFGEFVCTVVLDSCSWLKRVEVPNIVVAHPTQGLMVYLF